MQVIEGHLDAQGLRFALVVSRFNEALTSRLESGAVDCLIRHGAEDDKITIVRVPGAWEIPMVAAKLAGDGGFDAVISVGALVREAPHTSISLPRRSPRGSLRRRSAPAFP